MRIDALSDKIGVCVSKLYLIQVSLLQGASGRFATVISGWSMTGRGREPPLEPPKTGHSTGNNVPARMAAYLAPLRLGKPLLPGLKIHQEYSLHMVPKRPTDAQHRLKVIPARAGDYLALICGVGDLVQVAADAPKLGKGTLERQQLLFRQGRKQMQVSSSQHGNICGRSHPSSHCALPQEQLISNVQTYHQSLGPARPGRARRLGDYRSVTRLEQRQFNESPDQGRLAELLPCGECTQPRLRLTRDPCHDELIGIHVGPIVQQQQPIAYPAFRSKCSVTPTIGLNRDPRPGSARGRPAVTFPNRPRGAVSPSAGCSAFFAAKLAIPLLPFSVIICRT